MDGKDELKQPVSDEQTGTTAEATTAAQTDGDSTSTQDQALNAAFEDEGDDDSDSTEGRV